MRWVQAYLVIQVYTYNDISIYTVIWVSTDLVYVPEFPLGSLFCPIIFDMCKINMYMFCDLKFLTADLSHVTGGTKPDNQAEEEEDWEEGGVV